MKQCKSSEEPKQGETRQIASGTALGLELHLSVGKEAPQDGA
jgi:hypothetical protein